MMTSRLLSLLFIGHAVAVRVPAEYYTKCDVIYWMTTHATKRQNIFAEHFTEYYTACGGGHVRRMRIPLYGEWKRENKNKTHYNRNRSS